MYPLNGASSRRAMLKYFSFSPFSDIMYIWPSKLRVSIMVSDLIGFLREGIKVIFVYLIS